MDALCLGIDTENVNRVCPQQGRLLLQTSQHIAETLEALTYGLDGLDAQVYAAPTKVSAQARYRLLRPQILAYEGSNILVSKTELGGWMLGLHAYVTIADHAERSQTSHGIPGSVLRAITRTLVECGDLAALTTHHLGLYVPLGDWHSLRVLHATQTDRLRNLPAGAEWLSFQDAVGNRARFDRGSKLILDALQAGTLNLWGFKSPVQSATSTD